MDSYIGEIRMFSNTRLPDPWLPCDGRILNRRLEKYAALFSVIGKRFGPGIPGDDFALPDLRGRTVRGNAALGEDAGKARVTLTAVPGHRHDLYGQITNDENRQSATPTDGAWLGRFNVAGTKSVAEGFATSGSGYSSLAPAALSREGGLPDGRTAPHDNRQPYLVLHFGICMQGQYPLFS